MEETRWKEKNQYLGLTEDGRRVRLLDQSQLPNREVWLELEEPEELAEAIRTLRVRGAPAIGVFAAYALYVLARRLADRAPVEAAFRTRLREWAAGLAATRPTAVNLRWALSGCWPGRTGRQGRRSRSSRCWSGSAGPSTGRMGRCAAGSRSTV